MAMTQDITAQKRAEAALRSQRDLIAAIIETAAALVVVLDRKGRVIQFNRACQETSGYSFDEVETSLYGISRCCSPKKTSRSEPYSPGLSPASSQIDTRTTGVAKMVGND